MITEFLKKVGLAAPLEYFGQTVYGMIHPSLLRSGSNAYEERQALPGDDIIPHPLFSLTRAVTIETSCENIWPWLVQMGHGRGGWYGWYPFSIPHDQSSQCIMSQFQTLAVGDIMLDGPGCDRDQGAFTVTELIPGRTIVLHSCRDMFTGKEIRSKDGDRRRWADMSWVFSLKEMAENRTRLLVRTRLTYPTRWLSVPVRLVLAPGDTVMQRSLIFGIKRRAERNCTREVPIWGHGHDISCFG